ncbi:hypothetical protein F4805DRAFT_464335 [Annulohypoxylon moriforme]|nr:hypothetical protein F4805DRAFT_464335 [Annulohypoxylon moriforme]
MLRVQLAVALLVVVVSFAMMIWSITTFSPNSRGVGTYVSGSCSRVSRLNSGIHVLMNVFSGILLSSGNYCMQLLVSPSRDEIDEAHSKGISLRIGVPNVKNLWHVDRKRVVGWFCIGATATLLHLFWNSSIFTSLPVVSIPRAIATSDFRTAADNWTTSDPLPPRSWWGFPGVDRWGAVSYDLSPVYTLKASAANLTRLEPKECIDEYIDPLKSTRSVMVVARNMTSTQNNGSSLLDGWMSGWDYWDAGNHWLCSAYDPGEYTLVCNREWADGLVGDWVVGVGGKAVGLPNVLVDYCLVGDEGNNEDRCGLHYSVYILVIVCVCTTLECLLVLWTGIYFRQNKGAGEAKRRRRTLITMGDAISDFLYEPDYHIDRVSETSIGRRESWLTAINAKTWTISFILFTAGLTLPSVLIGQYASRLSSEGVDLSLSGIWQLGFSANSSMIGHSFWQSTNKAADLIGNIFVANSPQVIVSFIYLFFNNILTRQLVADEWSRFLRDDGKKTLRVTSPIGLQRSSYFLSLPLKYSIFLVTGSIALHWFISQGIFLVQTSSFGPGPTGEWHPDFDVSARGYSVLGVMLAIILGAILVIALIINSCVRSFRDIPVGFKLLGMSSAGIGLVCQRPADDTDAHLFPVSIGIVPNQDGDAMGAEGRLAFSTYVGLQRPKDGCWYLQPILAEQKKGAPSGIPHTKEKFSLFMAKLKHLLPRSARGHDASPIASDAVE